MQPVSPGPSTAQRRPLPTTRLQGSEMPQPAEATDGTVTALPERAPSQGPRSLTPRQGRAQGLCWNPIQGCSWPQKRKDKADHHGVHPGPFNPLLAAPVPVCRKPHPVPVPPHSAAPQPAAHQRCPEGLQDQQAGTETGQTARDHLAQGLP